MGWIFCDLHPYMLLCKGSRFSGLGLGVGSVFQELRVLGCGVSLQLEVRVNFSGSWCYSSRFFLLYQSSAFESVLLCSPAS